MKIAHLFLLAAICLAGCSKKDTPPPAPPDDSKPSPLPVPNLAKVVKGYLLKACDISLVPGGNFRIDYAWNPDSSLKRYQSRFAGAQDATDVDFHYSNGQLSRITTENSLSEGVYEFENGRVKRLTSRHTINPTGRNYYFTYNADGTVNTITYKNYNEAGEHLQQEVRYTYDAQKRPTVITKTQPNGHTFVLRIQEWSAPFSFSPWIFSESEMDLTLYELFNVPLLFTLDRMPTKFTENEQPVGGTETVKCRWELTYTIQQDRLEQRRAQLTYPNDPQLNRTVEHTFHY